MRTAALILSAALAASRCAPKCDVNRCPDDLRDSRVSVVYADGNSNAYILRGGEIAYKPVTPELSSSGIYSGGAPWKRALDAATMAEIARVINAAIDAKAAHIPDRVMGSGQITVACGEERRQWILARGSAEIRAIEAAMARGR